MGKTIQIKRGPKNTMPTLAQGELGMTTDSGAEGLFIGTGTKNIEMARKSDLNISGQISTHNSNSSAHSDIRKSVTTHTGNTSIHVTADQKTAWDAKIDVTDIVNNLKTNASDKPLSAAMGVALEAYVLEQDDLMYEKLVPKTRKVNGKALSSDITLSASDISADPSGSAAKALTDAKSYTDIQIAAIPTPDVSGQIGTHNINAEAHNDIRNLITGLTNRLNALADSDDATLDQLSEIVAYIKNNKSLIDGITTSKVNVADIINNLTTNVSNKPLSAAQGVALKALIDAITVPTKVSELTNDSGYLTSFTETDPTVPAWAKAKSKPSYTASEVGAVPTSRKVNGKALSADITLSASDVGAAPVSHTSDSTIHVTADQKATWNAKADAPFKPAGKSYLTFSSPNSFTLAVGDATKHWDGTLEYFASNKTWTVWDGTTTLSSVDNDGEYVIYIRGTGNTVITGNNQNYKWVLTGSDIKCIGDIENLLDYATVESGGHPTMANNCYAGMFFGCTALTQAPALPATTLADYCYEYMFRGCTSITQAPALPATTLASNCYSNMFYGCTGLTQAPALPATTLASQCYSSMFNRCTGLIQAPALPVTTLALSCYFNMFNGCTSLTQAPALPATTLADSCYRSMFSGCISLKLSSSKTDEYTQEYRIPSSGTGTTATNALTDMFTSTGGTFTGTPAINTTYYLSTDNMVVRETEIATLNGYVGSMIDAAIGNAIGGSY